MSDPVEALHDVLEDGSVTADAEVRELMLMARRAQEGLSVTPLSEEHRARIFARASALARRRTVLAALRAQLRPRRPAVIGAAGVTVAAVGIALLRARRHRAAAAVA